jgi:zinc protease
VEERELEVSTVTRDDLAAFHEAAYGPGGMVLAAVGELEADRIAELLTAAMETWAAAGLEVPTWASGGDPAPAEELLPIPDRPNIDVFLGHRGTLLRGTPDYAPAVLANACLGQSTLTSRLGVAVRDEAGLTYGVASRFFGTLEIAGPWATSLGVSADNLERAVELSRAVIAHYLAEGPREDELADERTALAGAYRVGLATNSGIARELVTALTAGEGAARLDRFPEELLAATRDDVVAALRRHIHPDRLVMTAAGDFHDGE